MKRTLTSSVIIFFLLVPSIAETSPRSAPEEAIQGLELILKRDYPEAEKFIHRLLREQPNNLLGYFGIMAYAQVRNFENYDFRFESVYSPWAIPGREKALRVTREASSSAWDLTLAGGLLGLSGFQKAHQGKWWTALWDAQAAVKALRRAWDKDPTLKDPLLGLGLYNYWRSDYTRRLRFLPFFADRREEGKRQIQTALLQGGLTRPLAAIALAFIEFHDKKYEDVLKRAGEFLRRYPENTIARMLRGQTLLEMKRYEEARREFEEILQIDPTLTKSLLFIGLAYAREGKEKRLARQYLERFLQVERKASKHWKEPAEEALKKLR